MAEALAEKTKIKDDEFDIHGDLAVSESDDKSFVVLYDSSKDDPSLAITPAEHADIHVGGLEAPSLDDLDESHAMAPATQVHPEDAYIDDILSSDDVETPDFAPAAAHNETIHISAPADEDDGPIALSSEELDGILEMGPTTTEEEFHPDFPVESPATAETPAPSAETYPAEDTAQNYDDEELPIALSDEDLDEILLEEEGTPAAARAPEPAVSRAAAPAPAKTPSPAPAMDFGADLGDDEEPIALSDDELDNILADAEAGHSDSGPQLLPANDEDEVLTLDENPELTMIDDGAADFGGDAGGAHSGTAESGSFFDSDEDEPITLSDEELDGILSSAPEEDAPKQTEEVALTDLPSDGTVDVEDDEPIALSNEELDGILMDAEEVPGDSGMAELPPEESNDTAGFFDGDEDEPIALSADELDGIAATAVTEDAPPEMAPLADLPPESMEADGTEAESGVDVAALDERYADVDTMAEQPDDGDDDGPIALSTDELDGIVADSHEVTPEAPMMPLSHMDSGADEPSLAENVDKPATVFEENLEAATLIHEDDQAPAAPTPDTEELKSVMTYLDNLLGELPDDVIEKFAQSEYFKLYQKIMDKLGL